MEDIFSSWSVHVRHVTTGVLYNSVYYNILNTAKGVLRKISF